MTMTTVTITGNLGSKKIVCDYSGLVPLEDGEEYNITIENHKRFLAKVIIDGEEVGKFISINNRVFIERWIKNNLNYGQKFKFISGRHLSNPGMSEHRGIIIRIYYEKNQHCEQLTRGFGFSSNAGKTGCGGDSNQQFVSVTDSSFELVSREVISLTLVDKNSSIQEERIVFSPKVKKVICNMCGAPNDCDGLPFQIIKQLYCGSCGNRLIN